MASSSPKLLRSTTGDPSSRALRSVQGASTTDPAIAAMDAKRTASRNGSRRSATHAQTSAKAAATTGLTATAVPHSTA